MAIWYPLRADDGGQDLVLSVDFGGARPEAGFMDLAARLPSDYTVLATRPPDHGPPRPARQIDAWRDAAVAAGGRIATVIGYCSGAAVAARLAEDLDDHRQPVRLVLVDPAVTTHELLLNVYHSSIESLAAVCPQPPVENDVADGPAPGEVGLARFARHLADSYAQAARQAGRELDLDDELVDDLVVRFRRYLSYLVVAGLAEKPAQISVPVLTVMSATHPEDAFPLVGDRRVRFDVARADLLADAGVGQILTEFIVARDTNPSSR
jgi:hypothetical protein